MARITTTIDDLTGAELSESVEPTTITVDGKDYSLDLSEQSKERLIRWLSGEQTPLLKKQPAQSSSSGSTLKKYGYEAKDVRAWAIANGKKGKGGSPITEDTKILHQGLYDEYRDAMKAS